MKTVVFTGPGNLRELSKTDFELLGIDHRAMAFPTGNQVEVSNECAETLTSSPLIPGEFVYGDDVEISGPPGELVEDDEKNKELIEDDDESSGDNDTTEEKPKEKAKPRR